MTEDALVLDLGQPADDWTGPASAPTDDAALYLELDNWEGPLDLLLDLARRAEPGSDIQLQAVPYAGFIVFSVTTAVVSRHQLLKLSGFDIAYSSA